MKDAESSLYSKLHKKAWNPETAGLAQPPQSFPPLALATQSDSQVVAGLFDARLEGDRLAELRDGSIQIAMTLQRHSEVVVVLRILRALELKPDYAQAHASLGLLYWRQADRSKALDSFRQAVMSDPDLPEAHYNLGLALAQTGHLQESIHALNEALSVNPSYLEARINLALVLSQNGDPNGAANVYREILKQNPGRAEIHNNLGLVLMQMKDSKAGIAFKEALRLKPDYAEAHYNLAWALL